MTQRTPWFSSWRVRFAPMGSRSHLTQEVRPATLAQIEERFAPALPKGALDQNPCAVYSRQRIFTLARTGWCWIWQIFQLNTACREVVRQVQALFLLLDGAPVDESTSAYCQARGKLPQAVLEKLFEATRHRAQKAAACAPTQPLLQGRRLRVGDGSGARLPDTPSNRAAFPPSDNLPAGSGLPYLRLVVLFCLHSGALLAYAIGSLHCGELRLFGNLLAHLSRGDILLGDRAYGCYIVAALLQALGVDLIARVPTRSRNVDFRKAKQRLGPGEALFVWQKPSKASPLVSVQQWLGLPQEITVRMVRVRLERPGFRTQRLTLMTTLLDTALYPVQQIIAAHARRWRMEVGLRDLKTTLSMERLTCQTPKMISKELLVYLIAYNLLRWLMAQAAVHGQVQIERISFKGLLDALRQWTQAMAMRRGPRYRLQRAKMWDELLQTLVADSIPDRPGRHEPRAVKTRAKYPFLNKPRHCYIERWSRNKRRRFARAKKSISLN